MKDSATITSKDTFSAAVVNCPCPSSLYLRAIRANSGLLNSISNSTLVLGGMFCLMWVKLLGMGIMLNSYLPVVFTRFYWRVVLMAFRSPASPSLPPHFSICPATSQCHPCCFNLAILSHAVDSNRVSKYCQYAKLTPEADSVLALLTLHCTWRMQLYPKLLTGPTMNCVVVL